MKSSYIIIILCIFGYISNLEEDQSFLYDIEYSSEYEVNIKDFSEGYIPKSTNLFFRLKITPSDNMAITLKTLISDSYPFNSLYAYEFSEKPRDKEAKKGYGNSQWLHIYKQSKSGDYESGIFPFKELWSWHEDTNYVVIYLELTENLHYLSILVSYYKKKIYRIQKKYHIMKNLKWIVIH